MEQDIKQQTVVYNKGITNVPSELLSTDGELVSCEGMTFESGELKPIQKAAAASVGSISGELMCVHDNRYIYVDGQWLRYKMDGNVTGTVMPYSGTLKDVTTVGNTVIAATSEEVHYALWTGSNYTDLGNKIPEPDVKLYLGGPLQIRTHGVNFHDFVINGVVKEEMQTSYNDAVIGLYEKCKKEVHANKLFAEPFVAVVAVELNDGSYTLHSSPHILLPWYDPIVSVAAEHGISDLTPDLYMMGYSIYATADYDYSKWSDIVKNVTLFVSREVSLINRNVDAIWEQLDKSITNFGYHLVGNKIEVQGRWVDDSNYVTTLNIRVLRNRSDVDVEKELEETSVFFKLCDLGTKHSGSQNTKHLYTSDTIVNLEVQQQLPNDDFHSHDDYAGSSLYSYNGRLHISGVKRYLFGGFKHFFPWNRQSGDAIEYHIVITLSINGEDKTVSQSVTTREAIGESYFYYPDPRAKEVRIYNGNLQHLLYTRTLTEHPGLNGAYWFGGFPTYSLSDDGYAPYITPSTGAWVEYSTSEELTDTIMVSEVDNPFLFLSKGYVKVNAPVVGMAAVTMALSEYKHGSLPLIAFTEKGIWSLTLNSEGYYVATQSESREVCNNAKSITQVDMGVYFTSAKGLMYLDTSGVTCVSEQMKGTSFEDFIDTCSIAYDYRDSLLHIFVEDSEYHYVYNMKSGTFSTMADTDLYYKAVNNYPDTLIQTGNDNILSLLSKPDEKDDQNVYEGTLVTRAIKFGNLLTLKSIRQMKHLYRVKAWKQGSWTGHQNVKFSVALTLKGSNDGYQWAMVYSLRGKPWRYWRFELALGNMSAADRLAGTVVWTQERRAEKIR